MVQDEGSLSTCPGGTLRFLLLRCISSRNSLDQARHQGSLWSGGDRCAKYPNGTEGQFKYYWEMLDNKSSEVYPACLSISAVTHRYTDLQKYKAIEKAQKNAVSTVYSSLCTSSF